MLSLIVGALVAGGTYAYAKAKRTAQGRSVAVAALTGAGATVLFSFLGPVLLLGAPLALGYYLVKNSDRKALPPGP